MLSFQLFSFTFLPLHFAQVGPGGLGEGDNIVQDGATASAAISAAMEQLWKDVLGGSLYAAIAKLGVLFAVGTLLIFMVQYFKALMEGDNPQAFSEIVWPLVAIVLLSNNAQVLAECTFQLRNIINQVNQTILTSTAGPLALQEAYQQAVTQLGSDAAVASVRSQCAFIADPQQQADCIKNATQNAQQQIGDSQQNENIFTKDYGQEIQEGISSVFAASVRGWLIAFGIAFQWIVEISFLLTGLLGPLAVGGSLLPIGQKSIFVWLTGFFSVGMVKLSFNIIVGLVATLVINAKNADAMVFAFATGLLAPILSLILATGGGMAVFNSLSSVATFGLNSIFPRFIRD
ncbi:hypothetical protein [Microcoleus sp. FACHB-831]|uniref:hypothetical protein n=1 Tax=Microcoleus sp. FACHB-831 TaxID=2692827 RepID=UPI001F55036C|nr:hypothetical protein [Microcoleus sp. FACHB-831]